MDYFKEQFKSPATRSLLNMQSGLAFKSSDLTVSVPTLYRCIKPDKESGGNLYKLLPFFGHYRKAGGKRMIAGASHILKRIDISTRPKIEEDDSRL